MAVQNIVAIVVGSLGLFTSVCGYILIVAKMKWEQDAMKERMSHIVTEDVCKNHSSQLNKLWDKYAVLEVAVQELQREMVMVETLDKRMTSMENSIRELMAGLQEIKGELKTLVRISGGKRDGD